MHYTAKNRQIREKLKYTGNNNNRNNMNGRQTAKEKKKKNHFDCS